MPTFFRNIARRFKPLALLVFPAAGLLAAETGAGTADFAAWRHSSRISLNTTPAGANVPADVADFPLLVRLNAENFIFSQAFPDGRDIRFQDPDGTSLGYTIDRWDAANKLAEVWVKIPVVDGNSDRDHITMFWGNASAGYGGAAASTFGNYKAVYHLGESPGGTAPQFKDSSGTGNHGTAQGGAAGDSVTAVIGKGFRLNGTSKYISTAASHFDQDVVTLGAWFRTVSQSGGKLLGWESSQTGTGGQFDRMVYMGNDGKLNFAIYNGGNRVITTAAAYNDGAWHFVAGRVDGTGMELYVDGVSAGSNSQTNPEATTGYWRAGYGGHSGWTNAPASNYFNGSLDEVFFAHAGFTSNYLKLAYQTQKPGSKVASLENTGLSNWAYSTKVHINTTASGANIASNQSNYPLLVRLNAGNFNFSQGGTTGGSIRFADSAGNLLPYEIERYDASSKLAEIWVLIPTVYGNNNSQWIRMHWGHPTATSLSSGAAVFLNSAGYAGVWHLNEDGNTAASGYRDASNAENHGTGANLTNASDVAGMVGIGANFAAASNQAINVAGHISLQPTGSALTVEAWVNSTTQGANRRMVGRPFTSGTSPWNSYGLELDDGGNKVTFSLTLGGTEAGYQSTSVLSNGTWYHVAGTYDGAYQRVYANGVLETGASRTGTVNDYSQPLSIGKYYHDNGSNWDGKLDEVRISTVARSADWLKLGYENMRASSNVVTVGNSPGTYSKSTQFNFNTTASGANVSGNVANIPILVRLAASNFDFTAVRDDGSDIRFIDKTGAALYHEVVEWDKGNKTGMVWVKVPQVDGNSASDFITAYYGCSSCTGNPWAAKDSVWAGYGAVYHLAGNDEKPHDAAGYGNHGTYSHALAVNSGISTALSPYFDGSSNSASVANNAQLDGETVTWSFWIKTSDAGNSATWFSSKWILDRDLVGTNDDWAVVLNNGNSKLRFSTRNNVLDGNVNVGGGAWHMVHIVKTPTDKYIYVDGIQDATVANTDLLSNDAALSIMSQDGAGNWTRGQMNDLWMHPSNRSADFIRLSFENQKESGTFMSAPVTTASFRASKVYRFNTTASGANVAGDVFDFPLLIRLADASIIDSTQMAGGIPKDLRFLDGDGSTWLPYQVERWDQGANLAEVWVKVPKVDGNSAGDFITMYWNDMGNGSVPDASCASCVFSAAGGFSGVWHLNEDGNNAANGYADASGNGNHGTGSNMDNSDDAAAMAGLGSDFNSAADAEYIEAGTSAGSSLSHSVSFWALSTNAANQVPVDKYPDDATGTGWNFKFRSDNQIWYRLGSTLAKTDIVKTSAYAAGTWVHVTGTFDFNSSTGRLYINGALQASNTSITRRVNNTGTPLRFATPSASSQTEKLAGKLDEIQISSVARDSNWVKLTYQTQRSDATPFFNPSQNAFLASRKYVFNTTRTGANVMGDVSGFPLLVRITGSAIVDAVQGDWDDIRFLDGDGKTWLNYSVERWSKSADSAEVWVMVPKVDGNSDRDFITLYYNDSTDGAVANGECAACVFPSTTYNAVWHLGSNLNDATANGLNLTNTNAVSGIGVSAGGHDFNNNAKASTAAAFDPPDRGSVSFWMNYDAASGEDRILGAATYFEVKLYAGNVHMDVFKSGTAGPTSSFTLASGSWYHIAATWNITSGVDSLYINGVLDGTLAGATDDPGTGIFSLGTMAAAVEYYDGKLDEVRITSTVPSPDFIKLSYETQRRSGNLFWNGRAGPDNKASLTATDEGTSIFLSWTTPVTDSSNADSIGIWVRYSGKPDSVGAAGQTKVVQLPKTDSAYSYPARYGGTYWFALAVRNPSGSWSPFTASSTDTVLFGGSAGLNDTIYVDSAIGTATGNTAGSCTNARNPATPLKEIEDAVWCAQASGFLPNDTLVVRVMPGTYGGAYDNDFDPPAAYPVVITSFDDKSRPILTSSEKTFTVGLADMTTLRKVDIRANTGNTAGIRISAGADSVVIDGVRIYNNGATRLDTGVVVPDNGCEGVLIANSLIHEPRKIGLYVNSDDRTNVIGNTLVGDGSAASKGLYYPRNANGAYLTITNNIFQNWDYGIHTTDSDGDIGLVSSNLFHMVTSANEVVGETDAAKISRDPRFYATVPNGAHAFKLLPGSPALNAGTSTLSTGASQAWSRVSNADLFGSLRPAGPAPDIGAYEGSGHTPNPVGEFDTLTNTVSGNTVIIKNGKWKLVWDMARGAGITGFYDMTVDSAANLVGSNSLLFDVKLDAYAASGATSNTLAPEFQQRTRTRAVVKQRLAVSASLDLVVCYAVYASGHVYVQSEIVNLSAGALSDLSIGYSAKVGTATAAALSGGATVGATFRSGHGVLTTSTRDVLLAVTQDLDLGAAGAAEAWIQAGSTAGASLDSVWMGTVDLADLAQGMKRQHHFLLYVGDGNLDQGKASALSADAYSPSVVNMSAGSLNHERSWQNRMAGHWTLDDGSGTSAKDKSIINSNDAAITSGTWVSGKTKGALRFTTSSAASVADNDVLEAGGYRTVMFWVKPDFGSMNSDAYILSKGFGTSDGWHFRRVTNDTRIRFTMADVALISPPLTGGTWNHLAAVVDGSRHIKLYLNGVLVAASTGAATAAANGNALRMGENGGTGGVDRFAGDIDDVRIYSTAVDGSDIQAVYRGGFSEQYGHYHLRADNNNRVVALLNEGAAAARIQPAFRIDNWYGPRTPRYVYLNGARLLPNADFVSDSTMPDPASGSRLLLQLNKTLTGADQTLFVDDDDSTGFLGAAGRMKGLAMSSAANDKLAIRNFEDTVFGAANSGQWHLELDLNGWTNAANSRATDTGFGEFNVWKAAAISPNVALGSATQLVGRHGQAGQSLVSMKFRPVASQVFSAGLGYGGPANISYTLVDSSAARLSLTLAPMTLSASGVSITLAKRWTVYPTGRIFGSFEVTSTDAALTDVQVRLMTRYNNNPATCWGVNQAMANARWGIMGGDPDLHSAAQAVLSVRSNGAMRSSPTLLMVTPVTGSDNLSGADQFLAQLKLVDSLFESADDPVTVNFAVDISRDFTDSATADSLMKDLQTPATLTALGSGTANPSDALDFNPSADGFAEGDGAYVYTAGSGTAHFKFTNTVTHFNPAFRIKSWTFSGLPEYVIVNNQSLVKDYHYNAHVNFPAGELILQFNRSFAPGTHLFYIAHKTGLAVTMSRFEAKGGDGVDTLEWTTESELENLGFHLYRRPARTKDAPGAGDSLPEMRLSPEELLALGYARITSKLIPGPESGSSASSRTYVFLDRTAAYGSAYEYLLESRDFSGTLAQYGPRRANPGSPLETALLPNHPNPFNPVTVLRFSLKEKAKVSLAIYDARGRLVRVLLRRDKAMPAGKYRLIWDARDERGFEVPSGQYFYRFSAPRYNRTRKMLLLK